MVLCKLYVAGITASKEQGVRAQAEIVVIGVSLPSVREDAQRACEEFSPGGCGSGFLRGVMAHCSVAFMEHFLIVGPGALREGGQFQDFGRKTHGDVFPNRDFV